MCGVPRTAPLLTRNVGTVLLPSTSHSRAESLVWRPVMTMSRTRRDGTMMTECQQTARCGRPAHCLVPTVVAWSSGVSVMRMFTGVPLGGVALVQCAPDPLWFRSNTFSDRHITLLLPSPHMLLLTEIILHTPTQALTQALNASPALWTLLQTLTHYPNP